MILLKLKPNSQQTKPQTTLNNETVKIKLLNKVR